jgi:RNA polymerase sigma factor (sigma-70 family)
VTDLLTPRIASDASDAELIGSVRAGDDAASAELFRRHHGAAEAAARALSGQRADAEDIAAEAFARVLGRIQAGGGPDESFRPYLLTTVRNTFYDSKRRRRSGEIPTDTLDDSVNLTLVDAANDTDDRRLAAQAFASLPERWQLVLWHLDVEGSTPADIAPLLGLAPNAVSALAYRAREGLRQAFLQAHLAANAAEACRGCRSDFGAYLRDGLSTRDRRRVDEHLDHCRDCRDVLAELAMTNTTLRAALVPALVGVPAALYLGVGTASGISAAVSGFFGAVGAECVRWWRRLTSVGQAAVAVGAAAVVSGMAVGATAVLDTMRPAPEAAVVSTVAGIGGLDGAGAPGAPLVTSDVTGSTDGPGDTQPSTDPSSAPAGPDTNETDDDDVDDTDDADGDGDPDVASGPPPPMPTTPGGTTPPAGTVTFPTFPTPTVRPNTPTTPRPTTPTTPRPTTPTTPNTPPPTTPNTPPPTTPNTPAPTIPTIPTIPPTVPTTPATTVAPTLPATTPPTTPPTTPESTLPGTTGPGTTQPGTTQPATTTPATTTPPTTVPGPPRFRVATAAATALVAGGVGRVRVTLTPDGFGATEATAAGFGSAVPARSGFSVGPPAPSPLTRDLRVPTRAPGPVELVLTPSAGLSLVAVSPQVCGVTTVAPIQWRCVLDGATASTLDLRVAIANGSSSVSITPSLGGGAVLVGSSAWSMTPTVVPNAMAYAVQPGQAMIVGNGVLSCRTQNAACARARLGVGEGIDRSDMGLQFIDVDGVPSTFNSSAASLDLGAGVVTRAVLVWSAAKFVGLTGAPDGNRRGEIRLTLPTGRTVTVNATTVRQSGSNFEYLAMADVTGLVAEGGSGQYAVANLQAVEAQGSFGAWALGVITYDITQPERVLSLIDPVSVLTRTTPWTSNLPVGPIAAGSPVAVTLAAPDGELRAQDERVSIDGVESSTPNVFDSSLRGARSPSFTNNFGATIRTITGVTDGDDLLRLRARSTNETVRISLVAVAVDVR